MMATKSRTKSFARTLLYSVRMMWHSNKLAAVLVSLSEIFQAIIPSVQAIFTGLTITQLAALNWGGFVLYLGLTVGFSVLRDLAQPITNYFSEMLRYDIQNSAVEQLYLKINKIPLAVRETRQNADKLEIAERYGLNLGWLFPQFISIISQIISMVVAFVVLAQLNWLIAIAILIISTPSGIMALKRVLMDRRMWQSNSIWRRKGWGIRNQFVAGQAVELKVTGLYDYFVKSWRKFISRDRETAVVIDKKFLPYETGFGALGDLLQLGVLIWAGKLIIDGALAIGFIMTIKNLMDNLSVSFQQVLFAISNIGDDVLNAQDYFEYLDLPEEADGRVLVAGGQPPKIEFRDVTFTYAGASEPALKNVSLTIAPGEDIALVGENGSGKTTLIKLLLGLYTPDSGEILVNDTPMANVNKKSYYKRLGALFQDYARYDFANLEENIWYGDITRPLKTADLRDAIDKARLGKMVAKLPHGLKQNLSKQFDEKNGTDLSGGQWQRVALARGFWRNPDVLILDEPTAAVDAKSEYEIFQEIARAQVDKTTIIISHRFSTVRKARQIYVMDSGEIVERGSHSELMQIDGGLYREMFTLQAEGYRN